MSWRNAVVTTSTAQAIKCDIEWGDSSDMPRVNGDMIRIRPHDMSWEQWIPIQGNILRIMVAPADPA